MQNKKGFTLIELLIVISIIGLLSSIILVGLGTFRARGRDTRRIADLRSIQNMLELYFAQTNFYPASSWNNLDFELTSASIGVNVVPQDPLNGQNGHPLYQYDTAAGLNYTMGATLEDPNNPQLANDIDGQSIGGDFSCADNPPVYCVTL